MQADFALAQRPAWKRVGISANFVRLTIEEPFRQSKMVKRNASGEIVYTNGIAELVDANLIGFSQIAYREYIPPAPPVVPEPGSIAVFGGLMAVGGWMRRRRRSAAR
ncbi:MAG: PEP-CTERM sorting domain-containing protein [Planctomycetes bacterium]|nr:PEP-CTERM sorting domain-containing protein [Planctomycetota bacterium]